MKSTAVRACVWSSFVTAVGFIQFTLGSFYADCPHKRAYNERVYGKEEHATGINTIPLKMSHLFGFYVSNG